MRRILLLLGLPLLLTACPVGTPGGNGMGNGPGMGGMFGTGGSGGVIDPPAGPLFEDPAEATDLSDTPGIVEVELEARIAPVAIGGIVANLMTYNGAYPGPTIRVRQGDRLRIHLKNALPDTDAVNPLGHPRNRTNLHTHGLHVSPVLPGDDVSHELAPGESYTHEYDLNFQEPGVLAFYHPHLHGLAAEQVWAGLAGALVVEDADAVLAPYETHLLVLKDVGLSGSAPAPHAPPMDYMVGKEGNIVTVNGLLNPQLAMKAGQVQRWRILNASGARFYRLALPDHIFHVIGTDGGLLDKPYPQSELILSPGERVDVLVEANADFGSYKLRSSPYSRGAGTGSTVTLLTVTYQGNTSPAQTVPALLNPNARRIDPEAVPVAARRTLTLGMGGMMGMGGGMGMGMSSATINGQDFDTSPYTVASRVGTYEIWTIVNATAMDHPFHQHVNPAMVLSVNGGNSAYASFYTTAPAWKDTVLVPRGGSVSLLVPVFDYPGTTVFHCHILEHEDLGMMGLWDIANIGATMP